MSFNFYCGDERKAYRKKFNFLKNHFEAEILERNGKKTGKISDAELFRYIVDLLYYEIKLPNKK